MTAMSIGYLKAWLELLPRLPAGPWVVQDGCSWRRIGTTTGRDTDGTVLRPTVAGDGHPDLECGRGQDREAILAHLAKCDPATIAALIEGYIAMAEALPALRNKIASEADQYRSDYMAGVQAATHQAQCDFVFELDRILSTLNIGGTND